MSQLTCLRVFIIMSWDKDPIVWNNNQRIKFRLAKLYPWHQLTFIDEIMIPNASYLCMVNGVVGILVQVATSLSLKFILTIYIFRSWLIFWINKFPKIFPHQNNFDNELINVIVGHNPQPIGILSGNHHVWSIFLNHVE